MAEVISQEQVEVAVNSRPSGNESKAKQLLSSLQEDKQEREREREERLENVVDKQLARILTDSGDSGNGSRPVATILEEYGYLDEQVCRW